MQWSIDVGGVWRRFHPRLGTEPPTATYTLKDLLEDVTPADVHTPCQRRVDTYLHRPWQHAEPSAARGTSYVHGNVQPSNVSIIAASYAASERRVGNCLICST